MADSQETEHGGELARLHTRISELEAMVRDRRDMEKTLRDQLRFLQILIDTIPNPIFYKNRKGTYLGCNKAFERRIGLDRNEIVGRSASDLFPQDLATKYEQHDSELFACHAEKIYETGLTYPDGEKHDVIITKGTFTDSDGEVAGLVGVSLDITERKRAEEALQKAHDELEKRVQIRTRALAEANRKLEREVAERSRMAEELRISSERLKIFAYSIAHDLKSPSVGIYGLTRLLKKNFAELLDEKGAIFCDQIMKASEHIASLVDAINVYIATKENPLKIEEIKTEEIFHMLRDEFAERLSGQRVELIEPKDVPPIRADRISLLRIFRNLIDNAIKYGGKTLTRIESSYQSLEDFHQFTVSDDGAGIEPDESGRIFNLFQRLHGPEEREGTGLGLAIVKEIVELHKGKIRVEKGKPCGTVFRVTISKFLG